MNCEICENTFEKNLIYENEKIKVFLAPNPATSGHIQLFPKEHYSILEQMPQDLLTYMAAAANKISILLFELLKVHGTNIIMQNGISAGQTISHVSIHIIPRRSDDGLKLDWDLKQAAPDALESMQRIISEGMSTPEPKQEVIEEKPVEKVLPIHTQETSQEEFEGEKKEHKHKKKNYLLQSLDRIP
ncbi:MAG: HIT family protein [Candidatus Woesearchaeota archaeon]